MDTAGSGLRPDETAAFQALAEQAQAMAIPPQNLDQITALAAKDEDMAAERIDVERRLHDGSQAIEATPHVGHTGN